MRLHRAIEHDTDSEDTASGSMHLPHGCSHDKTFTGDGDLHLPHT